MRSKPYTFDLGSLNRNFDFIDSWGEIFFWVEIFYFICLLCNISSKTYNQLLILYPWLEITFQDDIKQHRAFCKICKKHNPNNANRVTTIKYKSIMTHKDVPKQKIAMIVIYNKL